ncbi:hypothetical protein R1T08_02025 [Streptomyces sp. SBC-4]|nr:hypothetical protein [Streptomyces sp. SBC-4]MDV5143123.1 hypothetical protein [Streptomyces sp. SBC-4]
MTSFALVEGSRQLTTGRSRGFKSGLALLRSGRQVDDALMSVDPVHGRQQDDRLVPALWGGHHARPSAP